jgi:pyruvate/2-oxoglutarate/acetoin dehydrogenase E1 component
VEDVLSELDSLPPASMGSTDVFARPSEPWIASSAELVAKSDQTGLRVSQILNGALDELLAADPSLLIVGEDLSDPYGGAFKVTRGLSKKYGDRVLSTPISEAAIVGLANGWALAGGTSVVEIMFGDFVTLAAEQLINQAAKMRFMYNGQVQLALTVRLVSGGYRGYGATHSQSLEKLFCGVPGLKIVALSRRHDASRLLSAVVRDPNPVVFVENKVLYTQKPVSAPPLGFVFRPLQSIEPGIYPPLFFHTSPAHTQGLTVVTYGGLTDMVEAVLEQLILEQEMDFDYFVLSQLNGECEPAIAASASSTRRILFVEEGTSSFGVGAELIAQIAESVPGLKAARVGAIPVPIPSARHLEQEVLPTPERIRKALLSLL